jgi:hypothetical protein
MTDRHSPLTQIESGNQPWRKAIAVLSAMLLTSCVDRPPLIPGAICESNQSPVKNALAQYVERGLIAGSQPPYTPYRMGEGSRQRLIAVMQEMKASASSPDQQCESVGHGLCRVRIHCVETVLNARKTPRTYSLVLRERKGQLEPLRLLSRFDNDELNPRTGRIDYALLFENSDSAEMASILRSVEE